MKKIMIAILGVITLFVGGFNVKAASKCDYSELAEINQEAAGVKVSYEEKKKLLDGDNGVVDSEEQPDEPMYEKYFVVNITNVTDKLYVKVINPIDNSVKVFNSSDASNGVISFDWYDLDQVTNLTVKIYTSSKTSCADEEVVVQYQTLPMYNYYSTSGYCEEHKNEDICQQYVTKEIKSEEFYEKSEKALKDKVEENNSENKSVISNVTDFVKKNKKGFIIGGSIIIVVGVVTTVVVIIKRRRSRLI